MAPFSLKNNMFVFALFRVCAILTVFATAFMLRTSDFGLRTASALTLSLDTGAQKHGPGDTFIVLVRAEDVGEGECFNAADVRISYPKDLVNAVAVSKGESLLTLWPEEPTIDRGRGEVRFIGGIPAGYCGRVLGDPGRTDILAKLIFSIPGNQIGGAPVTSDTPVQLSFVPGTALLLNDGRGTPALVELGSLSFLRTVAPGTGRNEWIEETGTDDIPPEDFTPMVERDGQTFGNRYFLVFGTTDKQSGMHHFEISEEDPRYPGYLRGSRYEQVTPVAAVSPYQLKDQELRSTIVVIAVDNAGNKRRIVLSPPNGTSTSSIGGMIADFALYWWIAGGFALAAIFGGFWWRRKRSLEESH